MLKIPQIIGHDAQLEQLAQDRKTGNVVHAYLFSGPRHLGKMSIARWFALELLSADMSPEERTKVRNQVERLVHPDLLVLDQLWVEGECEDWDLLAKTSNIPQQHRAKKPGAKTDSISIEDIRVLQERLYETGSGKWRCCIIRSVERMQDAAANAFLKILEEPPPGLVFLLTTQSLPTLLPTVISRARICAFHRLAPQEIKPLLQSVSADDAQFIAHLAQGAPGTVIQLRDNPDFLREQRLAHSRALSFWRSRKPKERLGLLSPLLQRGEESDQFLTHLSLALREEMLHTSPQNVRALVELTEGLRSNAHRQLLTQQFVLTVSSVPTSV
ncbi:MAG: hypothetical protein WCX61_00610 [Candidatus Peribacteraceae bacterium]